MTCVGDETLDVVEGLALSTVVRLEKKKCQYNVIFAMRKEMRSVRTMHFNQNMGENNDVFFTELKLVAGKCDFLDDHRKLIIEDRLMKIKKKIQFQSQKNAIKNVRDEVFTGIR